LRAGRWLSRSQSAARGGSSGPIAHKPHDRNQLVRQLVRMSGPSSGRGNGTCQPSDPDRHKGDRRMTGLPSSSGRGIGLALPQAPSCGVRSFPATSPASGQARASDTTRLSARLNLPPSGALEAPNVWQHCTAPHSVAPIGRRRSDVPARWWRCCRGAIVTSGSCLSPGFITRCQLFGALRSPAGQVQSGCKPSSEGSLST
jgi:hypothetical protein